MSQCLQKKLSMTLKLDEVPRYFIKKVPGTFVHGTAHLCLSVMLISLRFELESGASRFK